MQRSLFGLHDATNQSFNNLDVGSVRLWDVGVTWKDLEVSSGVFDWKRLDNLVDVAVAANAQITYVLGQTPSFYADAPNQPPPLTNFDDYVSAVASRYRGKISHYQVWNEANVDYFFSGTTAQMADLTRTAALAVRDCDPDALVVGPSGPVRLAYQRQWYADYWNEIINGFHIWRWFDVNGFSLYPLKGDGPEAMFALTNRMRNIMDNAEMPPLKQIIHGSEINYDVEAGGAELLSDLDQIAMTMRTYLVAALAGIERIHWYRFDWGTPNGQYLANTYWTDPFDHTILTPAGLAFDRIKSWMKGPLGDWRIDNDGTYIAHFGTKTIAWNPDGPDRIFGYLGKTITRCNGDTFINDTDGLVVNRPTLIQ